LSLPLCFICALTLPVTFHRVLLVREFPVTRKRSRHTRLNVQSAEAFAFRKASSSSFDSVIGPRIRSLPTVKCSVSRCEAALVSVRPTFFSETFLDTTSVVHCRASDSRACLPNSVHRVAWVNRKSPQSTASPPRSRGKCPLACAASA